jgi:diacylglycerol kinase family enzyme
VQTDRSPGSAPASPIPAFVNPLSGSADEASQALERAGGFELRLVPPEQLCEQITATVAHGVDRILVAGGDGTIEAAASVLIGTPVALAVLPGGTLNHFARDHGIPTDPDEALAVARTGQVRTVDVGYVNDQLFINTSSVGAYVLFVRWRDHIERYFGYRFASVLAGIRVLLRLRRMPAVVEGGGEVRHYRTPLVFVGVGERQLTLASLGQRVPGGARGLHVILVRGRRFARRFARAYSRITRGLPVQERGIGLDTALVERFQLDLPGRRAHVATDGEIVLTNTPLAYRYVPDALRIVVPGDAAGGYARSAGDAR